MKAEDERRYDDIIDLPHPVSRTHPRMPAANRAAQFLPFAALSGYGDVIDETARLTDRRIELSESEKAELNARLSRLAERLPAAARLTWFVPDARKDGGRYASEVAVVRRILPEEGTLRLADGRSIPLGDLIGVEHADAK